MASAYITQQRKEIQQTYDQNKWLADYNATRLSRDVMNSALGKNMARSSVVGGTIGAGMVGINRDLELAKQSYDNALAGLKLGGSSGYSAPKLVKPTAPTAPRVDYYYSVYGNDPRGQIEYASAYKVYQGQLSQYNDALRNYYLKGGK